MAIRELNTQEVSTVSGGAGLVGGVMNTVIGLLGSKLVSTVTGLVGRVLNLAVSLLPGR